MLFTATLVKDGTPVASASIGAAGRSEILAMRQRTREAVIEALMDKSSHDVLIHYGTADEMAKESARFLGDKLRSGRPGETRIHLRDACSIRRREDFDYAERGNTYLLLQAAA